MIIDKVSLSKTIPTGSFMNDKIGIEATLQPGESYEEALNQLNNLINAWHRKANPALYEEKEKWIPNHEFPSHMKTQVEFAAAPPVINIQDEKQDPNDMLVLIRTAPTLEELKTYKTIASADQSKEKTLYSAYNQRLKQLSI